MIPRSALLGAVASLLCISAALAADPIKVGLIEDISGDLAAIGLPKLHGSMLAVDEINKAGGVLGRPLALTHLDPQGDNARYQEFARRPRLGDQQAHAHGGPADIGERHDWENDTHDPRLSYGAVLIRPGLRIRRQSRRRRNRRPARSRRRIR